MWILRDEAVFFSNNGCVPLYPNNNTIFLCNCANNIVTPPKINYSYSLGKRKNLYGKDDDICPKKK